MKASPLPSTPSFRLDGRRALVTGAGRGIGLAAAAALAAVGAEVTLVARNQNEIQDAAAAINAQGGKAVALALDVLDIPAVARAIEAADAFDILVNNAGMNIPRKFTDVSLAEFDSIISLNLKSAFFTAQAVARKLVASNRIGSIINMSSQMGHVGGANRTVYCASKFALEGMTKAMAIDLGPHGIRVNTICPTFIETPMTAPFFSDSKFRDSVLSKIKLGRLGRVEDITGAVVYLASEASALMTGASMVIDGGWTAD